MMQAPNTWRPHLRVQLCKKIYLKTTPIVEVTYYVSLPKR